MFSRQSKAIRMFLIQSLLFQAILVLEKVNYPKAIKIEWVYLFAPTYLTFSILLIACFLKAFVIFQKQNQIK